jgi:hypothetical protein
MAISTLLVCACGASADIVDSVPLDSTSASDTLVQLVPHTDAVASGAPVFPNGEYTARLQVHITGMSTPEPSSGIGLTIRNP